VPAAPAWFNQLLRKTTDGYYMLSRGVGGRSCERGPEAATAPVANLKQTGGPAMESAALRLAVITDTVRLAAPGRGET